jgi:hypothetical protein
VSEIVTADADLAEAALRDCLDAFGRIQFRVTGTCMGPDLLPGQLVTVSCRPAPRLGDVVLVRQARGLRLHRLVFGPPLALPHWAWRTKGDRLASLDPPLAPGDLLGTVVEPRRRRLGLALGVCARTLWARLRAGSRRPHA